MVIGFFLRNWILNNPLEWILVINIKNLAFILTLLKWTLLPPLEKHEKHTVHYLIWIYLVSFSL